jgi:hypothetical protein
MLFSTVSMMVYATDAFCAAYKTGYEAEWLAASFLYGNQWLVKWHHDLLFRPFLISLTTASLLFAKSASILYFRTSFQVSWSISKMSFFGINIY